MSDNPYPGQEDSGDNSIDVAAEDTSDDETPTDTAAEASADDVDNSDSKPSRLGKIATIAGSVIAGAAVVFALVSGIVASLDDDDNDDTTHRSDNDHHDNSDDDSHHHGKWHKEWDHKEWEKDWDKGDWRRGKRGGMRGWGDKSQHCIGRGGDGNEVTFCIDSFGPDQMMPWILSEFGNRGLGRGFGGQGFGRDFGGNGFGGFGDGFGGPGFGVDFFGIEPDTFQGQAWPEDYNPYGITPWDNATEVPDLGNFDLGFDLGNLDQLGEILPLVCAGISADPDALPDALADTPFLTGILTQVCTQLDTLDITDFSDLDLDGLDGLDFFSDLFGDTLPDTPDLEPDPELSSLT